MMVEVPRQTSLVDRAVSANASAVDPKTGLRIVAGHDSGVGVDVDIAFVAVHGEGPVVSSVIGTAGSTVVVCVGLIALGVETEAASVPVVGIIQRSTKVDPTVVVDDVLVSLKLGCDPGTRTHSTFDELEADAVAATVGGHQSHVEMRMSRDSAGTNLADEITLIDAIAYPQPAGDGPCTQMRQSNMVVRVVGLNSDSVAPAVVVAGVGRAVVAEVRRSLTEIGDDPVDGRVDVLPVGRVRTAVHRRPHVEVVGVAMTSCVGEGSVVALGAMPGTVILEGQENQWLAVLGSSS